jgi:ferric-dicitrate binding protein FerR (iron transport regulator)
MPDNLDNGQLNVKLQLILDRVNEGFANMVTKDLFDTWRQGNNERLTRLEDDHKAWVQASTQAHVELEAQSKARHEQAIKEIEELETAIGHRLDKERERNDRIEAEQRARKNATARYVIGLVVTSTLAVASLVTTIIIAIAPGSH